MTSYKVAIIGSNGLSGNLIDELLSSKSANFDITVLSRIGSTFNHSSSKIQRQNVDYEDYESLVKVLKGHDYMISLLGVAGVDIDLKLIDAAIAAGVKRIFGNEYTLDCVHPATRAVVAKATDPPIFLANRIAQAERLEREGRNGAVEWTTIVTSGFLEQHFVDATDLRTLKVCCADRSSEALFANDANKEIASVSTPGFSESLSKTAKLCYMTTEKQPATGCTTKFIAAAIAYGATHWDEVKNRRVHVAEVSYTGRDLVSSLEQKTGEKFMVEYQSTADLLKEGEEAFQKGDIMTGTRNFLISVNFGGSGAACFSQSLGYGKESISRKSLEQIVAEAVEYVG